MTVKRGSILSIYLQEIGKYPLLTHEEVVALAERIEQGDDEARKTLIQCNLRLVVRIARHCLVKGTGLRLLDLIECGNFGLLRAAKKFDRSKGFKFSTYATRWIRHFIQRGKEAHARRIMIPQDISRKMSQYKEVSESLARDLGRAPLQREIADAMKMDVEKVCLLGIAHIGIHSLEALIFEDTHRSLEYFLQDTKTPSADQASSTNELKEIFQEVLKGLPEQQHRVIALRYGLYNRRPCTLQQVADWVGLTKERVRQIQKEALGKLRRKKIIRQLE